MADEAECRMVHEARLLAVALARRALVEGWSAEHTQEDLAPYLERYAEASGAEPGERIDATPPYDTLVAAQAEIMASMAKVVAATRSENMPVQDWLDHMEMRLVSDWEARRG